MASDITLMVVYKTLGAGGGHFPLSSRPKLVEQWHPSKNEDKTPASVSLGSNFRAWWQCRTCGCGQSHEWQTQVQKKSTVQQCLSLLCEQPSLHMQLPGSLASRPCSRVAPCWNVRPEA